MLPFPPDDTMPAPVTHLAAAPVPLDVGVLSRAGFLAVELLAEATSTMNRAREIACDPVRVLPAIVVADRQTAGRGRRDARWWQPPGSLAASLVLDARGGAPATWSLACGVAVAEAVRQVAPGIAAQVRWPNDVEIAGRKLAGILVEQTGGGVIFGIGLNTAGRAADAPAAIRDRIVTLPDVTGAVVRRDAMLAAILPRLLELVAGMERDPSVLAARYRPLCAVEGRRVTVHAAGLRHEGVCRGIAADGALVVDTSHGRMRFASGSLNDPAAAWRGDEAS